jgi:predicted N-acetyltransferase YhbS
MTAESSLIPLDHVDAALVEALLDRAFEPERRTRTAYRLREGTEFLPALSFAAINADEDLVGTIQCWPVALTDPSGRRHPLVMVGPVAVTRTSRCRLWQGVDERGDCRFFTRSPAAASDDRRS